MTNDKQTVRVLGVDGGGSKTKAWIANALPSNGRCSVKLDVLGRGTAGPSNPRSVGFETAFVNLGSAIASAIENASVYLESGHSESGHSDSIAVACLSLAGAGRSEEQNQIRSWADQRHLAKKTIVLDDVEPLRLAAMYEQELAISESNASSSWEQSVTLVVGTGSIACGRNGDTISNRVGGWGYLLGDQGSGFTIGLAGLRSICESHDRNEPMTSFQQSLMKHLQLRTPTELVGYIYATPLPRAQVAELSEIVLAHADAEPVAAQIRDEAVSAMVGLVSTATRRLGLANLSYSLALSGGVVSHHAEMVERLMRGLEEQQSAPRHFHIVREPIYGSLLMAAQTATKAVSL